MSIELCVLASGSSGNCSVVRTPAGVMLIDAGIGPRSAEKRLAGTGVTVADVRAVCLTHLDRDHFCLHWIATLIRNSVEVHCDGPSAARLKTMAMDECFAGLVRPFSGAAFEPLPGLKARPIPLTHDWGGSHAFVFEGFGRRLGYATDLGHAPMHLADQFAGVDVLALESNYDPQMQEQSARSAYLKRRIMGGRGHLSNHQAFETVRRVLDGAERRAAALPAHIVLLHRSRQCNCPMLIRRIFSADARITPRLVLAEQSHRTQWLSAADRAHGAGEQMLLAWA